MKTAWESKVDSTGAVAETKRTEKQEFISSHPDVEAFLEEHPGEEASYKGNLTHATALKKLTQAFNVAYKGYEHAACVPRFPLLPPSFPFLCLLSLRPHCLQHPACMHTPPFRAMVAQSETLFEEVQEFEKEINANEIKAAGAMSLADMQKAEKMMHEVEVHLKTQFHPPPV